MFSPSIDSNNSSSCTVVLKYQTSPSSLSLEVAEGEKQPLSYKLPFQKIASKNERSRSMVFSRLRAIL